MIEYQVVVNGEVKETIRPVNQRLRDVYWFMVDRMDELKNKYEKFDLYKRVV